MNAAVLRRWRCCGGSASGMIGTTRTRRRGSRNSGSKAAASTETELASLDNNDEGDGGEKRTVWTNATSRMALQQTRFNGMTRRTGRRRGRTMRLGGISTLRRRAGHRRFAARRQRDGTGCLRLDYGISAAVMQRQRGFGIRGQRASTVDDALQRIGDGKAEMERLRGRFRDNVASFRGRKDM